MTETRIIPAAHRDTAADALRRLVAGYLPGRELEVIVRARRATRSSAQNRALWGVAYAALRTQTGHTLAELHDYFCGEHFGWIEHNVFGQRKRRPRRTTTTDEDGHADTLSRVDFSDLYAFVQQRAAENGYYVPDPGEDIAA